MISRFARVAAAAAVGLCVVGLAGAASPARAEGAAAGGPPPLSAYGHLPSIEQAAISPDGQNLAVIFANGEARKIVFLRLSDFKITGTVAFGDQKVRAISWAGPRHLLVSISQTTWVQGLDAPKSEWYMAVDYNLETHKQRQLMEFVPDVMSMTAVMAPPMVRILHGRPFAFVEGVEFVNNMGHNSLFKIDLDHWATTLAASGAQETRDWVVDADGHAVAQLVYLPQSERWQVKINRNGWRTVKSGQKQPPALLGLGRDGRSVLIADRPDDQSVFRELALDADDWGAPFAAFDDEEPVFDPVTQRLIGVYALVGDKGEYHFFDNHDQAAWNATLRAYPGARVTLASWSDDRRKLVVLVDSPSEGPAYAVVDLNTSKANWVGDTFEDASRDLGPVTSVAFKAADGTPLTGYLTLPKGRDAKDLPLVVFPHGGPAARDEPGFDWWAQAMASRGYAVLQVNYRGSEGFGWKFESSGFGQWGRAMQTDLSDGVSYLAGQGKVDPKRVCIVGASYGGYAALAGATLQPGLYRCAVSVAGPSEMRRMVAWSRDQNDISAQRYWLRFMGADSLHDARLEDISPADHADQVKAPILLIHGKDDTVVPFEQTQIMADALKRAGKPYEVVTLKHEDHWLSHPDTRLQMLQAVIDFLQKNNPPA